MSTSVSKELAHVRELVNEFKLEEALQLVSEIEQIKNLTIEETLSFQVIKGRIYSYLGEYEIAHEIAEELYQESQRIEKILFSCDALSIKEYIIYNFGLPGKDYYETIEQHENLFYSIPRKDSSEYKEREAILLLWKGAREFNKGDLSLALKHFNNSLKLFDQIEPQSYFTNIILMGIAYAYNLRGELDLALEYTEKASSRLPEGEYHNLLIIKAGIYQLLGSIFYQKGDLDNALEYYIRDLEIYKKVKSPRTPYTSIIDVLLAKKDLVQARNYLEEYKRNIQKPESNVQYQVARALILKASPRIRDHFEAANILKNFVEDSPKMPNLMTRNVIIESLSDLYLPNLLGQNVILVNLIILYLEEFRLSNQLEVLEDIKPLISLFQRNAKLQNSYTSLANVKLFKAKIALLQVNMVEARKLLTEAQQIAEEHDLQRLAGAISREHDRLLEELKLWESIKKEQASVVERLKLASVDGVMERLQGRGSIEVPEISVEEPILLIIMDKGGISYFNHSFIGDWDFDDLFSSFMSAFNDFSGEMFSRSIDRIKSGEYTILINPIEPFLACYIIKGQSYPAQQKLTRFSATIKANSEIWNALTKARNTGEILQLDDPPSLGTTVSEIFLS
ncbi:MAG: hypothetical protein ACXAEX_19360 [Promethearchaeota archaeon]|jgi:tetratricopeptide (TPR) repeat protein